MTGKAYYLEDFCVGQTIRSIAYSVSSEEIIDYARVWDPQPFHTDEEAARASVFGGLTACSSHIFAMFSIISQSWENGGKAQAIAGLGFDALRMVKPVYAGDVLRCLSTTVEVRRSRSKPDRGIVRADCRLVNQHGETVFTLTSTFMIKSRS